MRYHIGRNFSTPDEDNDDSPRSCAVTYEGGGWWYGQCHHSNLNGRYWGATTRSALMVWPGFIGEASTTRWDSL